MRNICDNTYYFSLSGQLMMIMRYSRLIILFLIVPLLAKSQSNQLFAAVDSSWIDTMSVKVPMNRDLEPFTVNQLKMVNKLTVPLVSMAINLTQATLAEVKTYGTPTLATLSIRGLGSQHCVILWNGFNLQNSMHGTTDVSLSGLNLPTQALTLNYGSSCAKDGSGAVAGSLSITDKAISKQGVQLSIGHTIGSFGYRAHQMYVGLAKKSSYVQMAYTNEFAKNDFWYSKNGNRNSQQVKLKNATTDIHQFNISGQLAINGSCALRGAANYTFANRQIPPTESQSYNRSFQKDKQLKSYLMLMKSKRKTDIMVSAGYFYDELNYTDPLSNLVAISKIHKLITKFNYNTSIKTNHQLGFGLENNFAKATTSSYDKGFGWQNMSSMMLSYHWLGRHKKTILDVEMRQSLNNQRLAPFLFDLSFTYRPVHLISMQVKAARIYRVPTLNDLYWNPGGNRNLLPEKGWHGEWMLKLNYLKKSFSFDNSISNFYYLIDNWIVWLPSDQGFWVPKNIKTVFSRGLQEEVNLKISKSTYWLMIRCGYQFNLSTQISSEFHNEASQNKQLIYEPIHKVYGGLQINYKGYQVDYSHQFTSKRFTSSDNIYALPSFYTAQLMLSKTFSASQFDFVINAVVENLYNATYYMIESRPMPRRNFKIGIIFKCNNQQRK